jgi:small subunit ribosomal protein S20
LANIKSQIKRNKQNEKRRINNRNLRGASRTAVNQARASLAKGAPETKEIVLKAISELDKAAEKGVIHKNAAARRKGRLMKKLATFVPAEATADTKAPKKGK